VVRQVSTRVSHSTGYYWRVILLIILALATLSPELKVGLHTVWASPSWPEDRVFAYTVDLGPLGIEARYIVALDSSRVAIAGTVGGVGAVAVVDVSDPYVGPKLEDLYPLTGSPTYVGADGFPQSRIVVGSDRGELLVFRVDGGRLAKHLYVVLGADFYVNKVYLARDAVGRVRVVALVSERGPRTYPCTTCYIYLLDEEASGILRIGPTVGNATALGRYLEGMYVQDVAPLAVHTERGFYWDASRVLVAYIPSKNVVRFSLNVTYVEETVEKPASGALVEVAVLTEGQSPITYGVNANERGLALIPVPVDPVRTTYVNLTIRNYLGTVVWFYSYTYSPKQFRYIPDEIPLPKIILPTQFYDSRPASKVYGVPDFLKVHLTLYDMTPAPSSCTTVASANFLLDPTVDSTILIQGLGEVEPRLVYSDSTKGYVYVVTTALTGTTLRWVAGIEDYVGLGARVADAVTYTDGSYLLVGLSDGRVRMYVRYAGGYSLRYVYPMVGEVRRITPLPQLPGYSYAVVSSAGIQVLRVLPYPLPVFRNVTTLYASAPTYLDGDVLADLTSVFMLEKGGVTVIKNSALAVERGLALPIDSVVARAVVFSVVMPGNESLENTIVRFSYPGGEVLLRPPQNGTLELRNIVSGVTYRIDIVSGLPYVQNASLTFTLREGNVLEVLTAESLKTPVRVVGLRVFAELLYREFTLRLVLLDDVSGLKLVAPVDIYVDGRILTRSSVATVHEFTLLYGEHVVEVVPSKGFEAVYVPTSVTVFISSNVELALELKRSRYPVTILILDDLTDSAPIAPLVVQILNTSTTVPKGFKQVDLVLPYGEYLLVVRPANGYERVYEELTTVIKVPAEVTVVRLSRRVYSLALSVSDPYSGVTIAPLGVYLNGTLAETLTGVTTATLQAPYGVWNITIAPLKGYEEVYESVTNVVEVDEDKSLSITVQRVMYSLLVELVDPYGRLLTPVTISIEGPATCSYSVEPPASSVFVMLPYGNYSLRVRPSDIGERVYKPVDLGIALNAPRRLRVELQRVTYALSIRVADRSIGILIGKFMLYANGTVVASEVGTNATVELPYGIHVLRLVPESAWERVYSESKPVTVSLTNDTSVMLLVERKLYRLRVVALEGSNPISNALVTIVSWESGATVTQLLTDDRGVVETSIPYGTYKVVISHPSYVTTEEYVALYDNRYVSVSVRPTLVTILWRYAPLLGALVGIGVATYVALRIRASLLRRLVAEEEIF